MESVYDACYELVVAQGESGQRLDRYLVARELPRSRSQLKRFIDQGLCEVNGQVARPSRKLKPGDAVVIRLPPPAKDAAEAEAIALAVLYEDEELVVVDKPAGMVVHPSPGHDTGTLVNALLGHCEYLSGVGGRLRPGIVHRLDMLTSGVMVASKTDRAHLGLTAQFACHSVERRYLAIVCGRLTRDSGTFETLHGRHPRDRKKFTTHVREGKRAVTHYQVLAHLGAATLVEATLETGRTHQVRVHFAEAGHAVLGDPLYGRPPRSRTVRQQGQELGRQALHARVLGFDHPVTGEHLRFSTPLPDDMRRALDVLSKDQDATDNLLDGQVDEQLEES